MKRLAPVVAGLVALSCAQLAQVAVSTPAGASTGRTLVPAVVYAKGNVLYRADPDLSHAKQIATEAGGTISSLDVSGDGTRVGYIVSTSTRSRLIVRDVDGGFERVIGDSAAKGAPKGLRYSGIGLTSTGANAVYEYSTSAGRGCFADYDVDRRLKLDQGPCGGVLHTLRYDLPANQANGTDTILYGLDPKGTLKVGHINTGTPSFATVAGIGASAYDYTVSGDGKQIAYAARTSTSQPTTIKLGTLSADGTSVSDVQTLVANATSAHLNTDLSFSEDGANLYYRSAQGSASHSDIQEIPTGGGDPTNVTNTPSSADPMAYGAGVDTQPPGAVTPYGAILAGSRTELRWALPSDGDLRGVRIGRSAPGTPTRVWFVTAPTSQFIDSTLVRGTDYTYVIAAVDTAGNGGPTSRFHVVATSNAFNAVELASSTSVSSLFRVHFPVSDHAKVWYADLSGDGTFQPWNVTGEGSAVFGRDGDTVSTPGHTYAFRIQVFDKYDNASFATTTAGTLVPLDQNGLRFVGPSVAVGSANYYNGTARVVRAGSDARVTGTGIAGAFVGSTCPTCGLVDVFVNGKRLLTVDTYSATRQDRVRLVEVAFTSSKTASFLLRPRAQGTHRDLVLDGYGFVA